jgi:hypothetical protein
MCTQWPLNSQLNSQCGEHSEDSSMDVMGTFAHRTNESCPAPRELRARLGRSPRCGRTRSFISHLPATPREASATPHSGVSFDARSAQARATRSRTEPSTNILISTFYWPYHDSRTGNVDMHICTDQYLSSVRWLETDKWLSTTHSRPVPPVQVDPPSMPDLTCQFLRGRRQPPFGPATKPGMTFLTPTSRPRHRSRTARVIVLL